MTTHTPGPWNFNPKHGDGRTVNVNMRVIAVAGDLFMPSQLPEDQANARLIAEAPELLKQLRLTFLRLRECANTFYGSGKAKDLQRAFEGWIQDTQPARELLERLGEKI